MHHYFLDNQKLKGVNTSEFLLLLRPEDLRHAKAQRLRAGEHISICDADGVYYELEVVSFDKSGLKVRIASRPDVPTDNFEITLIQGISKQDKMSTVLRATTELGISRYVPCCFKRSIIKLSDFNKPSKYERLNEVARSASMQSGRLTIPEVSPGLSFNEALDLLKNYDAVIVFYEGADLQTHFEDALSSEIKQIAVMIGPEGGFEPSEVEGLKQLSNVHICSLGRNILRTETAGIVSVALVTNWLHGYAR